jgi:ribosomal protein L12E/L44/L45/RPP1/RPP2
MLPAQQTPATTPRKPASGWVWAFRIVRWSTYLAALVTIMLLLHKAPPPSVQASPQAAARAEQKLEAAEQAASQGQQATLKLDETELNSYLATHLDFGQSTTNASSASDIPGGPSAQDIEQMRSSVKDVKVQIEDDRVKAYIVFDLHGKDMTLELVGKLGTENGYLRFEPVSGQIGSLPIPQSSLQTAVQHLMDSPENREQLRLPPDISGLRIENGELVATYH